MFKHISVLKEETIQSLNIHPNGIYVDCTLGGGGHAYEVLKKLDKDGRLIGFDQDKNAISTAGERLKPFQTQLKLVHANFRQLDIKLRELGIEEVDGFLFDLGVSSPQLDHADRGFSYREEAVLDMRMNQAQSLSAYEIVNEWPFEKLTYIFSKYGEERFSKRIARNIEAHRKQQPIKTTTELSDIVREAIPAATRRTGGHPAKRVFQAIRIAVNDEMKAFNDGLHQAARLLKVGGRISVITFHSLEDRLCKQAFRKWSSNKPVPRNLPMIPDDHKAPFKLINRKPILPKETEVDDNRRSRSAKLRTVEKIRAWDESFCYEEGWNKR